MKYPVRPRTLVAPDNRAGIFSRFEAKDWANTTYERLIAKLKPEIERHEADPRRFMKGIYFDWDVGQAGTVPPFYYTTHIIQTTVNGRIWQAGGSLVQIRPQLVPRDRDTIGSGLNEINGCQKQDLVCRLRLRFRTSFGLIMGSPNHK